MDINPPTAWTIKSYPGSVAPGPSPNPLIEQYTRPGLSAQEVSAPRPKRAITPGKKFSTSTSARRTRSWAMIASAARLRSRAMERFVRLTHS